LKVLITGASSGIGREMARQLHRMGHELFLAARSTERLNALKAELDGKPAVITADLSRAECCTALYERLKSENIDILINNAGFGLFGFFDETDLDRELEMLDLNVRAVHILTKLFLHDFEKRNSGYVLNVASSAAFLPGPLMSVYYATKAYVLHLSAAISEELRRKGSRVYVGALCPGPVDTNFNRTAGVTFNLRSLTAERVAKYGISQMLCGKTVIIPGLTIKLGVFFERFLPMKTVAKISYNIQKSKDGK